MVKKDFVFAAVIGLVTAAFASPLLYFANDRNLIVRGFGFEVSVLWLFVVLPVAEYIGYIIASKLFSHVLILRQLGRFGIVGVMNFCVDTSIVTIFAELRGIDPETSAIIPYLIFATSVAIVNSYFWQRSWTFAEKAPPSRKEFIGFVMITVLGIAINTTVTFILLSTFAKLFANNAQLISVAKIGATGISLFWNFLGYKFFVFKS